MSRNTGPIKFVNFFVISGKIKTLQMSSMHEELKIFFEGKPNQKALLDLFNKSYQKEKNLSCATKL